MSDRNDRIREAFEESPSWDRDRVMTGFLGHARQVRRRRTMYRVAGAAVGASLIGGLLVASGISMGRSGMLAPATLDSITNTPAEEAVITTAQQGGAAAEARHEIPSNLMPLLGHRSSLNIDLQNLQQKRLGFIAALEENPSRERAAELRAMMATNDEQIAATRNALQIVDWQLAGISGAEPVVTTHEAVSIAPEPIHFAQPPMVMRDPFMLAGGVALAAVLTMFAALFYFRRTSRATIDALSALQGQAAAQMSALTSGIEAIALEVERLGENQRYMSRVVAGESKEGVEVREK